MTLARGINELNVPRLHTTKHGLIKTSSYMMPKDLENSFDLREAR